MPRGLRVGRNTPPSPFLRLARLEESRTTWPRVEVSETKHFAARRGSGAFTETRFSSFAPLRVRCRPRDVGRNASCCPLLSSGDLVDDRLVRFPSSARLRLGEASGLLGRRDAADTALNGTNFACSVSGDHAARSSCPRPGCPRGPIGCTLSPAKSRRGEQLVSPSRCSRPSTSSSESRSHPFGERTAPSKLVRIAACGGFEQRRARALPLEWVRVAPSSPLLFR